MHSTLKLRESDPHDVFSIAPETVPATWADKVLADITRDGKSPSDSRPSVRPPSAGSSAAAAAAPAVATTFRAAADDIRVPNIDVASDRSAGPPVTGSRTKSAITVFIFVLCSAFAAAAWQHYGDAWQSYGNAAKQMISGWTLPFALSSPLAPEPTGQADTPAADTAGVQASTQASTEDTAAPQPAPAQTSEGAAPAVTALSPEAAQLQSMARDLAAMGQQVEQLKASIAELRASQQSMAAGVAKTSEAKASLQNPRPRPAPPPRPAAASLRKPTQVYPMPAYTPVQAAAPQPLPQQLSPAPSLQPAPPPPSAAQAEDDPVMRPPMPLR